MLVQILLLKSFGIAHNNFSSFVVKCYFSGMFAGSDLQLKLINGGGNYRKDEFNEVYTDNKHHLHYFKIALNFVGD